jgi:hypothetical protein
VYGSHVYELEKSLEMKWIGRWMGWKVIMMVGIMGGLGSDEDGEEIIWVLK